MRGQAQLEWLPDDCRAGGSRAAGQLQPCAGHRKRLDDVDTAQPGFDIDYFTDLSSRLSVTSQSNLLNRGEVRYAGGEWWDASMIAQGYQTIDGTAPYRMLPRLALNASREIGAGTLFDFRGDSTYFEAPRRDLAKGAADRALSAVVVAASARRVLGYPEGRRPLHAI